MRQALELRVRLRMDNKTLFYGAYTRTASYFANSELALLRPAQGDELELLEPLPRPRAARACSPQDYEPPVTDGSGNNRDRAAPARSTCSSRRAGGKDGKLVNAASGQPFELRDPAERRPSSSGSPLPFPQNLRAARHRGHASAPSTPAQYQKPHRRLRLRHDRSGTSGQSSRRATSSAISGAAPRPTAGQPQPVGHQGPGRRRADRAGDHRPRPRRS